MGSTMCLCLISLCTPLFWTFEHPWGGAGGLPKLFWLKQETGLEVVLLHQCETDSTEIGAIDIVPFVLLCC